MLQLKDAGLYVLSTAIVFFWDTAATSVIMVLVFCEGSLGQGSLAEVQKAF